MPAHILLINGYPGTGKSTLLRKLTADLELPGIGKDVLKETLSDTMKVHDVSWSNLIGSVAARSLNLLFEEVARAQQSVILENAFITKFAKPELTEIIQHYDVQCLEVYCTTEPEERRRRIAHRRDIGERHVIHMVAEDVVSFSEAELAERYAPLRLGGEYISVDTTHFAEVEYQELLSHIRATKMYKEGA